MRIALSSQTSGFVLLDNDAAAIAPLLRWTACSLLLKTLIHMISTMKFGVLALLLTLLSASTAIATDNSTQGGGDLIEQASAKTNIFCATVL